MKVKERSLGKALVIVDLQNDFCPHGALAVPEGDTIIHTINMYIKIFSQKNLPIFATRDWHPQESKHFKDFGGVWPKHCIQHTEGARFHPKLTLPKQTIILSKGKEPEEEGYSAFEGVDNTGERFESLLKRFAIQELYIGGLATDYCVKATAIDALKRSFSLWLLTDAIKGVDIVSGDSERAIQEMVHYGAMPTTLDTLSLY